MVRWYLVTHPRRPDTTEGPAHRLVSCRADRTVTVVCSRLTDAEGDRVSQSNADHGTPTRIQDAPRAVPRTHGCHAGAKLPIAHPATHDPHGRRQRSSLLTRGIRGNLGRGPTVRFVDGPSLVGTLGHVEDEEAIPLAGDITFVSTTGGFEIIYSDRIASDHRELVAASADWLEDEVGVFNLGQIDDNVLIADGTLTEKIRAGLIAWWSERVQDMDLR